MAFKESDIVFDSNWKRGLDNSDIGFKLKGHVLRWVSGGVEARRAPRFWEPLKVSQIPETKGLRKNMEARLRRFVDGDTIRRRDLILCYAPMDLVKERQQDIREQQQINEGVFRPNQSVDGNSHVMTDKETGVSRETISSEQFK